MRYTLAILALLICASSASAQTDIHLYGGGVLGGEEYTRGFLGGSGATHGPVFVGADGHGLWFTDEGEQLLLGAGDLDSIEYTWYGLDAVIGFVVRNATDRMHFIPIGIVGFSTLELEACRGTYCEEFDAETKTNIGAGFIAAFKGESGRGIHAGFRYTRNYGYAMTVGYVWTGN